MLETLRLMDGQFNAHGVELGQRYLRSGAVIDDGSPWPIPARDPDLYYTPATHPGHYLPHVWLEHGRTRVSTLDICDYAAFTLIVGTAGKDWASAARRVAADLSLPLIVRSVGMRQEYDDVLGDWTLQREVSDRGCILVRPDRYIAWRAADLPDGAPDKLLRDVLLSITQGSTAIRVPVKSRESEPARA
jgi:2,4-dichlorophenol 6-monooxygenase